MLGALATLLMNAEYVHVAAPAAVLAALLACLKLDESAREMRWEGKVF